MSEPSIQQPELFPERMKDRKDAIVQSVPHMFYSEMQFLVNGLYLYCWVPVVDWRVPKSNMKGCHHVPCAIKLVKEDINSSRQALTKPTVKEALHFA